MRLRFLPLLLLPLTAPVPSSAARMLGSTSLSTCMDNSGFAASLFNVTFTPDNGQLMININGVSSVIGKVLARISVRAYGFTVMEQKLDPCNTEGLAGMCPMAQQPIDIKFQRSVPEDTVKQIPVIAYNIPDLDGVARMEVFDTSNTRVACVEAPLSNGKTVKQNGVSWVTAIIAGGALLVSAITSGMGNSWTGSHVAANALSLFSYFQCQVMIAMVAVKLPPLVSAWTQNYDWAMGIIRIRFMQQIFHWYIQATGGHPNNLLRKSDVSIQVQKRSNIDSVPAADAVTVVSGIERLAFIARIEDSNVFMTGMSFFVAFIVLVVVLVSSFRAIIGLDAVKRKLGPSAFENFRISWLAVLRGILHRVVLIGFPQMMVLCAWEFVKKDSPAAVTLAVFFFFSMLAILGYASFRLVTVAKHSKSLVASTGGDPTYALYSNPSCLTRWGALYKHYRHERYFYFLPLLAYILIKSFVIALIQRNGKAQSVALMIVEILYLIAVSTLRPWQDRRTNLVNIFIASINALNSIIVLIFSKVTPAPDQAIGVLGVVFFVVNAVFALVLLILVVVSVSMALFSKAPEERYMPRPTIPTIEEKPATPQTRDLEGEIVDDAATERAVSTRSRSVRSHVNIAQPPESYPLPPSTSGSDRTGGSATRGDAWVDNWTGPPSAGMYRESRVQPVNSDWQKGVGYELRQTQQPQGWARI